MANGMKKKMVFVTEKLLKQRAAKNPADSRR